MVNSRSNVLQENRLLKRLPAVERTTVRSEAEVVEVAAGEIVCEAGARVRHVYFPREGVLSLFARISSGPNIGVGFVRNDGMFGIGAAAGDKTSCVVAIALGAGRGDRIETRAFVRLLARCPGLKDLLFAYACETAAQMAYNSACAASHSSRQRVARWLLDVTDGMGDASFSSTQESIASSLGLQRPAVSHAASHFQQAGFIRYARGRITVLDRAGLGGMACPCSDYFQRPH